MVDPLSHPPFLPAWQGKKVCGGFTMVELIIVIMVLGVLAAAALPSNTTGINAVVLARQLMMDVRLAQSYAMNRGTGYSIRRTTDTTNSYEIRQPGGSTTMPGTATTLPDATLSNFDVSFDALGVPGSGATITVTVGGQSSTVTITATTGQVTQP
ncbi:MAG: type II secretion system protein [Magnetococcales bacterium]|nr:type II secretion system protein [Magnetococcales bacterium]NGZ27373.1 type II secretion system protein [Magnetococcales bacterium]